MTKHLLILLIALASLTSKVWLSSTTPYLNDWDERYHALVAKNIAEDNSFLYPTLFKTPVLEKPLEEWSTSHVWLHKQPLTTSLIALSIKVFGVNERAVRMPSILFSTLSILLVYLIGNWLFSRSIGLLAGGIVSINGIMTLLATGRIPTDHVDLYFQFFLLVAGVFIFRPNNESRRGYGNDALVGLAIGLAVLVKWLPAYTLLLVYLAFKWNTYGKKRLLTGAGTVAMVSVLVWLPWQWYAYRTFPELYELMQAYNWRHVTESLGLHDHGPFYFLPKSIYLYGEIWLVGLFFLGYKWWKTRGAAELSLLVWILVPTIFFSLPATKLGGYTFFTLPAVALASALVLHSIYRSDRLKKWQRTAILIGLLLSPMLRFYESFQFHSIGSRPAHKITELPAAMPAEETVIFNSPHPINDMFYLEVVAAYEDTPSERVLDSLRRVYTVYIVPDPPTAEE